MMVHCAVAFILHEFISSIYPLDEDLIFYGFCCCFFTDCFTIYIYIYIYISAVKLLITINTHKCVCVCVCVL